MTNPLGRFTVSGDYGTGVDLECDDCPLFIIGVGAYTPLTHLIELAEQHNKEKHSEVQS